MKKILIIHHGMGVGGGLIALLGLIDELKVSNKIAVLSIFDSEAIEYIKKTGVEVIRPNLRFYLKLYELFVHSEAAYFNIIDCVKKIKSFFIFLLSKYYFAKKELEQIDIEYDIVYLNSTFISDWAPAAKKLNKKVVIHIREPLAKGLIGFRKKIITRSIKKNCDHIIAITKDNGNRINIPNKTTIVYDPVVINNRALSENININNAYKYFVYVGGMIRIKGFEQLVHSLDYLDENIRIFFIGDEVLYNSKGVKGKIRYFLDTYIHKHEILVKKLMKSSKVIYIGKTMNVFQYYSESIALVSPFSKPHASLPVLEAFSVGLPVIVSDIESMLELINDNNGLVFRNNKPLSLADSINKMSNLSNYDYQIMKESSLNTYNRIRKEEYKVSSLIENI